MPIRRLPVRPDLSQLKHQAKDLLRDIHAGDPAAITELRELHPDEIDPTTARLADAQLVLARSYQASSWTRLVQAVQLAEAIRDDNLDDCPRREPAQRATEASGGAQIVSRRIRPDAVARCAGSRHIALCPRARGLTLGYTLPPTTWALRMSTMLAGGYREDVGKSPVFLV